VFGADGVAELVEEFFWFLWGGDGIGHCNSLFKEITGCYTVGVDCTSPCSLIPKLIWGIRPQVLERSKRKYIRNSPSVVGTPLAQ
jgi:hypothetical protein